MRKFKKTISFLLLFVYLSALFVQNAATGTEIGGDTNVITDFFTISLSDVEVTKGDTQNITVDLTGFPEQVERVYLDISYGSKSSQLRTVEALKKEGHIFEANVNINIMDIPGRYEIKKAVIHTDQNYYEIHDTASDVDAMKFDFSNASYTIINTLGGLNPINNIEVEQRTYSVGDVVTYTIYVDESQTMINGGRLWVKNENYSMPIELSKKEPGILMGTFEIKSFTLPGWYEMESIQFYTEQGSLYIGNNKNDWYEVTMDFSGFSFEAVGGVQDSTAPLFESLITPAIVNIGEPAHFEIFATDDFSGVTSGSLIYVNEKGIGFHIGLEVNHEGRLVGQSAFSYQDIGGAYTMKEIRVFDKAGNVKILTDLRFPSEYPMGEELDLSAHDFELLGTIGHITPSLNILRNGDTISMGQNLELDIEFENSPVVFDEAHITVSRKGENYGMGYQLERIGENRFKNIIKLDRWLKTGEYYIRDVSFIKNGQNYSIYNKDYDSSLENPKMDFSMYDFYVVNEYQDYIPKIDLTSIENPAVLNDTIIFDASVENKIDLLNSLHLTLRDKENPEKNFWVVLNYDPERNLFTTTRTISRYDKVGTYEIDYVTYQIGDMHTEVYNRKYYPEQSRSQSFPDNYIIVEGTFTGEEEFLNLTFESQELLPESSLEIEVNSKMEQYPIQHAALVFQNAKGTRASFDAEQTENGLRVSKRIHPFFQSGRYQLVEVSANINGDHITIRSDESNMNYSGDWSQNFKDYWFSVSGTIEDQIKPVFHGLTLSSKKVSAFEKTYVQFHAEDDLSGIDFERIELQYESADGIGNGFSVYYDAENQNHFIEPYALSNSGNYRIQRIVIRDNAGNELFIENEILPLQNPQAIQMDLSSYDIEVMAYGNYNPDFSITVNKSPLFPSDELHITLTIPEEELDVDRIYLYYEGFGEIVLEKTGSRTFEGVRKISKSIPSGSFELETIQMNAGGYQVASYKDAEMGDIGWNTIEKDLSAGDFQVEGTLAGVTPELSFVVPEKPLTNMDEGLLEIKVEDSRFKANFLHAMVTTEKNGKTYQRHIGLGYDEVSDSYKTNLYVSNDWVSGEYTLESLGFEFGQDEYITVEYNQPLFTVIDTLGGYMPDFELSVSNTEFSLGELVKLELLMDESLIDIRNVTVTFGLGMNEHMGFDRMLEKQMVEESPGKFVIEFPVLEYTSPGPYTILYFSFNGDQYYQTIYNEKHYPWQEYLADLSLGDFTVSGTKLDETPPVLKDVLISQSVFYIDEKLMVDLEVEDFESGIASGYVEFANVENQYDVIYLNILVADGKVTAMPTAYYYPQIGTYQAMSVYLTDHAGNSMKYKAEGYDQGENWGEIYDFSSTTITFRNRPINDMTFTVNNTDFGPREHVVITGTMNVPLSGYVWFQMIFEDENGNETWGSGLRKPNGSYETAVYISPSMKAGEHRLKEVRVHHDNLMYTLVHDAVRNEPGYKDLSSVKFNVSGTYEDYEPPVFNSVSISKNLFVAGDKIKISVKATDAISGIHYGYAALKNKATGKLIYMDLRPTSINQLEGEYTVKNATDPGDWIISILQISDEADNYIHLVNQEESQVYYGERMDFSHMDFKVTGTFIDNEPPIFVGAKISKNSVRSNETVEITLNAYDVLSDIREITVVYFDQEENIYDFYHDNMNSPTKNIVRGRIETTTDLHLRADGIALIDSENNHVYISSSDFDLAYLDFDVKGTETEDITPYLFDARIVEYKEAYEYGDSISFQLYLGEAVESAKEVLLYYKNVKTGEIVTISTTENNGEYNGRFGIDHPKYQEEAEYQFLYMDIIQDDSETITIHSVNYPESTKIFYSDIMDFKILKDLSAKVPTVLGFSTENKTIGVDESIKFMLQTDEQGHKAVKYDVYFMVNGIPLETPVKVTNMSNQVFYSDPFTVTGEYQVDYLLVYGPTGDVVRIDNSRLHENTENLEMDLGEVTFSVRGTISDKTKPIIESMEVLNKEIEKGVKQSFNIQASDDNSGVDYGILYLTAANNKTANSIVVYLYPDVQTGKLTGTYHHNDDSVTGIYEVSAVEVYDKALNVRTIKNSKLFGEHVSHQDLSYLDYEVLGLAPDTTAPVFTSISKNDIDTLPKGMLNLNIIATDGSEENASGIRNMYFHYNADGVTYILQSEVLEVDSQKIAVLSLDSAVAEKWTLTRVDIFDHAGNKMSIIHSNVTNEGSFRDLSQGNYTFETPYTIPEVESVILSSHDVMPGKNLQVDLRLLTQSTLPEKVSAHFRSLGYEKAKVLELHITPDGRYEGIEKISEYEMDGEWLLEKLTAVDPYGKVFEIRMKDTSFGDIIYTIKDTTPDDESAELQDINLSKVEKTLFRRMIFSMNSLFTTTTSISEFTLGDTIRFSVQAEDAVSGVNKIKLEYTVVNQKVVIEEELTFTGGSQYTGEFTIEEFHPSGDWRLDKVTLYDNAENETTLMKSETTGFVPGYSKLNFRVTGTQPDRTAPIIGGVTVSSSRVLLGDKISYTVEASDEESEVKEMTLRLISVKTGVMKNVTMKKVNDASFQGILTVTPDMPGSTWRVERITAKDTMNNEAVVTNALLGTSTLSTRRDLKSTEVTVVTEQRIEVVTPSAVSLNLGDGYKGENLEVRLVYSEGEPKTLTKEQVRIGTVDTTKIGESKVTIAYNALSTSIPVTVSEGVVESILVNKESKNRFFEGEDFTAEGLEIEVTYQNGYKRSLPALKSYITGYDSSQVGHQTLTVTYLGKTTSYEVEIVKIQVESIEVKHGPDKIEYIEGQKFDGAGIEVEVTMNNGSKEMISSENLNFTGFDSSRATENQEVTVSYEGKTDTFTVSIVPKVLTSIDIETEPTDREYVEGQDLIEDGMKVIGSYNDGSVKTLEASEYSIEGYNKNTVGEQIITVKAGDFTDTFIITVVEKVVESIKIVNGPTITKYVVGQTLLKEGLSVQAAYNDGDIQTIDMDDLELTGFNSEAVAENQEVTVIYEGKTATFTVNIIPKALTGIKVQSSPSDTEYVEGQELNEEGLTVVGIYNDESERVLDKSEYTLDGYNKNTIGEQTITVKSLEFTTTFTVTVIKKAVAEIIIEKLPAKLSYIVGQVLESEGIEVKAHYNDGEEKVIPQADLAFSGFDSVAPASKQLITVSYEGKTKSFEIDIIARRIIALEVKTEPEMMIYVEGQKLNLQGLTLEASYNDGKKETVDHTKIISEGYDASKVGEQKINLKADEAFVGITVTVIPKVVESIRLISLPTKTSYVVGQKLDITGISVEETYNDGEKKLVKITMDHISGFDSSKAVEDQVITITYMEKDMTFTVDIIEKVLTLLTITKEPSRVLFYVGEILDLTGIEAMLLYNDLEEKTLDVLASMISGFDSSKPAQKQVITITYEGKTASFTVDVLDKKGLEEQMEDLAGSLSSEKANELKNLIDAMEDTPENKKIIEEFTSILQEVRKIEKVDLTAPAPEDKPHLKLSEETLKKLNLPEVLEDDVVAMTVTLQTKQIPENIIKDVQDKLGKKENVLLLYDMSLVKTIEKEDGSISEGIIENKDIRGKLTLRVPVPETMKNKKNLEIIYVSETGKIEKLKTEERTEDGIRYLYFETSHFSMYGIIAAAEEIIDENEEKPDTETEQPVETPEEENTDKETTEKPEEDKETETETDLPKTGETGTSTFLFAGILMMAAGAFFLKKKSRRIS